MNIEGILVPIVTPFTADNQVDTALLAELVDAFIAKGVRGIVACGTTGEYYALSEAERETVLNTIVKAAAGRCTLIAGVSDMSSEVAAQRAIRAKELGYDGLMLSAPHTACHRNKASSNILNMWRLKPTCRLFSTTSLRASV